MNEQLSYVLSHWWKKRSQEKKQIHALKKKAAKFCIKKVCPTCRCYTLLEVLIYKIRKKKGTQLWDNYCFQTAYVGLQCMLYLTLCAHYCRQLQCWFVQWTSMGCTVGRVAGFHVECHELELGESRWGGIVFFCFRIRLVLVMTPRHMVRINDGYCVSKMLWNWTK